MAARRYFRNLLLAYVGVVSFVTLAVTATFYVVGRNQTLRELRVIHEELLDKSAMAIDGAVEQAFDIADRILIDADFRDMAARDELDYYQVTKTVERLSLDSGVFGGRGFFLGILIPGTRLVVTSEFSVDIDSYLAFLGMTDDSALRESIAAPSEGDDRLYLREAVYRDSLTPATEVISFVKRVRMYRIGTVHVFIHFSKSAIFPSLPEGMPGSFGFALGETDINWGGARDAQASNAGGAAGRQDAATYTRSSSAIPQLTYTYRPDASVVELRLASTTWTAILIALMAVAIGTLLAYVWAGRIYRPIRSLVGSLKREPGVDVDDEIEFVHAATARLQSRNEYLRQQVEAHRLPLKTKLYRDAFLGTPGDDSEAVAERLAPELAHGAHVALISLIPQQPLRREVSLRGELSLRGEQNVRLAASALVQQELPGKISADVVDVDERAIAVVVKSTYDDGERTALHEIASQVEQTLATRVVVAVGRQASGLLGLRESYEDAAALARGVPIEEGRLVLDGTTDTALTAATTDRLWFPPEVERTIWAAVESGDRPRLEQTLSRLIDENFAVRSLSRESIDLLLDLCVGAAHRAAERSRVNFDLHSALATVHAGGWDAVASERALSAIYTTLMDTIAERRNQEDDAFGRKMVAFVEANLSKDISVLDLAREFNLSPTYAGKAFQRYTSEAFKDFLNSSRVRHAKAVLVGEPQVKIKDLAVRSGFANVTSFIRMFKRYEGKTPHQYQTDQLALQPSPGKPAAE